MNYAKLFQEIFANVCYIYVTIQPNSLFFFPRMMCERKKIYLHVH